MNVTERLRRKVRRQRDRIKSLEYLLHCIRTAPTTHELTKRVINNVMGDAIAKRWLAENKTEVLK